MGRPFARPLALLLLLTAIAVSSLYLTLSSNRFERLFRNHLEAEVERRFHGILAVDSLQVTPLTLSAEFIGIAAHWPSADPAAGPAATLTAERARVQFSPFPFLWRRTIRIRAAELVGARLSGDLDEPALLAAFAGSGTRGPLGIGIDRLSFQRCRLQLRSASRRLAVAAEAVDADLRLRGQRLRVGGEFAVTDLRWRGWQIGPGRAVMTISAADGRIELNELLAELRTGTLSAHGIVDTNADEIELETTGSLPLEALSSILGRRGLLAGRAEFTGTVHGRVRTPRLTGRVAIAELGLFNAPLATALHGDLVVAAAGLRITAAEAIAGSGMTRFRADLPFAASGALTLDYTAEDVPVGHLLRHLSLPVGEGLLTGAGELTIPYDVRPLRLETALEFRDLEPLLRSEATDPVVHLMLGPFAGAGHLGYENGVVELNTTVDASWGHGGLAGTFAVDGPVDACIEIPEADLGALSMLEGPDLPWLRSPPWYRLEGPVAASVTWTGTTVDPIFAGSGSISELAIVGAIAGRELESIRVPGGADFSFRYDDRLLEWDAVSTSAVDADAHGSLRLATAGSGTQEASLRIRDWAAGPIARLLGVERPTTGTVDLEADLHFDGRDWAAAYVAVGSGTFDGRRFSSLDAHFATDRAGLTVEQATIAGPGLRATLAGRLERTGEIDLSASVGELSIASLAPRLKLAADAGLNLELRVVGTTSDWSAEANLAVADGRLDGSPPGCISGTAHGSLDNVHVELTTDYRGQLIADVVPATPFAYSATMTFEELPLAPLALALLPSVASDLNGAASGRLAMSGEAGAERPIAVAEAEITSARLAMPGFGLTSERPWRLRMGTAGGLEVRDLIVALGDGRLAMDGTVGLGDDPWDLAIVGTADLQLARAFVRDIFLSGPLHLDGRLSGLYPGLQLAGTARLESGYIRTPALPYPLRDTTATARLDGRVIRIDDLRARFGGGLIRARASLDLDAPGGPHLAVAADGEDVRFTLFDDLKILADPVLSYDVSASSRRLTGTLNVTRATYELPEGGFVSTGSNHAAVSAYARSEALRGFPETALDLHILAPGNLWLNADWIRLEGDGELRIGGTTTEPSVLGSVRFLSQEKLELDGRRYRVTRGTMTFDSPTTLDPAVDFEATSAVQGYELAVRVGGRLSAPRVSVHSTPPLAEGDVLALLGGGQAQQGSGVASVTGGQEILYQMLLPRAFGPVPLVSVSPDALRGRRDPTEVFPFTIQLPERVDVTVGFPRREAATELVILNWRPVENYTLSAIRDLDRSWAVEGLVERRFGDAERAVTLASRVSSVEVHGLPPELEATVRQKLKTGPGRAFSQQEYRADLDRLSISLRDNGYPLARVAGRVDTVDDHQVAVEFAIELGAEVAITITGDEPGRGLLRRMFEAVQSFGLYSETEGELERVAHESYERAGHALPLVACARTGATPQASSAVRFDCEVELGHKYRVSEVRLAGVESIPEQQLRSAITTRSTLFRPARLISGRVEADMKSIRAIYGAAGFLRATVRGEILPGDEADSLRLLLTVDEGEQFRIGKVAVTGATAELPADLLREVQRLAGEPFAQESIRLIRDRLFQAYDRLGHLGASVQVRTSEEVDTNLVDVAYEIDEATPVRLGEVRVKGLRRARLPTVLQTLDLERGGLLSYGRLARAQRRLYDLGVFRSVELNPIAAPDDPNRRDVEVLVEEGSPYRVELGGGFDSHEGLRGVVALSDTNFMGRGRYLGLQLAGSTKEARAQLLLRVPRLMGRDVPTVVTGFAEHAREVSFDADRLVFRTEVERRLERGRRSRALVRYSLSATNLRRLKVSTIEAGEEEVLISSLGSTVLLDHRDDILEPRHGLFGSLDLVWASGAIGSEVDYTKLTLKAYRYASLGNRLVWASGAQIGLGIPRGSDQLPLGERYFAGGASSLRGFPFNEAGPSDVATGRPTGGNAVLVLNQELRLDLFGPIVTSVFIDAGNVYRDVDELGSDLRWSVGMGLRYRAAVVAGIDYARLLDAADDEPAGQLRFSLGYAF